MTQLNLATIQIGKEESAFGTETGAWKTMPGLVSKGDVTPTFKRGETVIQNMGSRNEAEVVLHDAADNGIKMKMRLQNGRPFLWLMGGYAVVPGIQIDTTANNVDFVASADTITRTSGDWEADGLEIGDTITIADSSSNDGEHTIVSVTALVITTGDTISDESMTTGTLLMSPPFQHTITNSNTIDSYSVEHIINKSGSGEYANKFLGGKCNELTLTMTKGQPVIVETTFICQHHELNKSPDAAPSILTTTPWEFFQATELKINNVEYKTKTRQIQLTLSNGIEGDWGIASYEANSMTEGLRKGMMTFEIFEEDEVLMELFTNSTDFPISLTLTRGTDTIILTVANAKVFAPTYDFGGNAVVDILPVRIIGDWTIVFKDEEVTYDI